MIYNPEELHRIELWAEVSRLDRQRRCLETRITEIRQELFGLYVEIGFPEDKLQEKFDAH